MDKKSLRKLFRTKLAAQSEAERDLASRAIINRLCASKDYRDAGVIFTYISTDTEVDTRALIQQAWSDGKQVAAPRMEDDRIVVKQLTPLERLHAGPHSILEPPASAPTVDNADMDLIIVPGLAFTRAGVRLGHGLGHFDRWLATLPPGILTAGLAFDFQVVDELPQEPHDIRIQKVLINS